jgi:redox-sensitive bicupin YhaK (pirin superfamily)
MFEVRRSRDRGYEDHGWLKTYHTFSFGDYYDPEYEQFGPLRVLNEDRVKAGNGFPTHGHQDMEILTYVLEGELEHRDSMGNGSVIRPGDVQRLSAGTGITHSEFNPSSTQDVHLLQIWIKPAKAGIAPSYEQKHFGEGERRGRLRLVASSDGIANSVKIHQNARMYAGFFHEAERVQLEIRKERRAFVQVARGSVAVNETRLDAGDGMKITQTERFVLQNGRKAHVLIFDLP